MTDTDTEANGRPNQKRRTRKDLLRAAARLMRDGATPTLEDVAEAALVSRATAYRYFPGIEALLLEASLDIAIPEPDALFGDGAASGAANRLDQVDAALHDMVVTNEPALRMMLARSLERSIRGDDNRDYPSRQNRRSPLIEAALLPERDGFDAAALDRLSKAMAVVVGPEALVVFKDVLQIDDAEAREIKRWMIRALVDAAQAGPPTA